MSFIVNDDGELMGSGIKQWNTTLETGEKVRVKREIVLDGMDVNAAFDAICRTLIISRQKNERAVSEGELISENGKPIHFSEMGRKIVSKKERLAKAKAIFDSLSDEEKAELGLV